jgi:Fe-S-cluster containining protein
MELGEATLLADKFVTSVLFKMHSLPLSDRSGWAEEWWRNRESRIPLRPALDEGQRHLGQFASRRRTDKRRDRQVFLDISAIVDDGGQGRCPALVGDLCSIYEDRPLTCRTVPVHYSRSASTLQSYLDKFAGTPGYRCDTTSSAPIILDGNRVIDPALRDDREKAIAQAKADRRWKESLVNVMDDDDRATAAGLPTYDAVLLNSDNGYATLLPMLIAWRIASKEGLISREELRDVCQKQATLIRSRIAANTAGQTSKELLDSLAGYEFELSRESSARPLTL